MPIDVIRFTQLSPEAAKVLKECYALSSHCWVGYGNRELACMFGLIPPSLMSNQAYLWLQTTPKTQEHPFIFIRAAQRAVEQMLEIYPIIYGHCLSADTQAIRWVKLLGAKFGESDGLKLVFTIGAK